jgi:hypothetical protein
MRRLSLFCAGLAVFVTLSWESAPAKAADFSATLSGDEEVPPVDTDASGSAFFTFQTLFRREFLITVRFQSGLSGPATGAHIHNAPPGVNGPIVLDFSLGSILSTGFVSVNVNDADDLSGPLAGETLQDLRDAMENGNTYINVHTAENPGGEIRGQITAE